jgi:N-formylglutamate amidohydrolase
MTALSRYSLEEIKQCLQEERFPVSGITPLGTAEFHFIEPSSCLGVALHPGGRVRSGILEALEVNQEERFREEDPYTDLFIRDFPFQLIARDSRFEYDLNWEIEKCIYPSDTKKWGLQVWKRDLIPDEISLTYLKYREFHALMDMVIDNILTRHAQALVFDVHTFCYQRNKITSWWTDSTPEINLGTFHINRTFFTSIIDLFLQSVSGITVEGHTLRVAENEIFPGGYLTRKYAKSHNIRVLVLAIEYKKIFMNEVTGELHAPILETLVNNLVLTKDRILRTKW